MRQYVLVSERGLTTTDVIPEDAILQPVTHADGRAIYGGDGWVVREFSVSIGGCSDPFPINSLEAKMQNEVESFVGLYERYMSIAGTTIRESGHDLQTIRRLYAFSQVDRVKKRLSGRQR